MKENNLYLNRYLYRRGGSVIYTGEINQSAMQREGGTPTYTGERVCHLYRRNLNRYVYRGKGVPLPIQGKTTRQQLTPN